MFMFTFEIRVLRKKNPNFPFPFGTLSRYVYFCMANFEVDCVSGLSAFMESKYRSWIFECKRKSVVEYSVG